MTIRWPETVLRPQSVAFDIRARSIAGSPSISGTAQVISSSAGIWVATFGSVVVSNRNSVIAARAMQVLLEGRVNPLLVPRCRDYQPVADGDVALGLYDAIPHDDDAYFDDGSGYSNLPVIDVTLSAAMSAGATTGSIAITHAGTIQPGQDFSIGERMYRLKSVVFSSASAATISFLPPLREAAANGAQVNFDDPVCRMRLATDGELDLLLDGRKRANPDVNFVEDL